MSPRTKLLYVYEERIPSGLQEMVVASFPADEFEFGRLLNSDPDERKIQMLEWAELALFAPGRHFSDDVLSHAGHIQLMQLWSSGFDKFNTAGAARMNIPVANNGGSNAQSVAEHAVLLMLSIYKWLPNSYDRTITGNWQGNSHGMDMFTLSGKTLGIIGFGRIGKSVARIALGFGMRVIYHDIRPGEDDTDQKLGVEYCTLDKLLRSADILSLHLHLTDQTRGLIGAAEFAAMKSSSALINVSRAELVDTDALLEALKNEFIWAAGMDVFDEEPTQPGNLLLEHPHVVATPHMAGSTYDAYRTSLDNSLDNFRRVLNGEKPHWVVNGV